MKRTLFIWVMALLVISCGTASRTTSDKAAASDPEEELLNTGYGHVKKKNYTGSISKVKVKSESDGYTDIYEYIRGRVPGVMVRGTSITIRGINSINSGTEPLILVDGVEVSDLSSISPAMVDSIDVLKDAASTAIYGVRGANGVILITLKKQ